MVSGSIAAATVDGRRWTVVAKLMQSALDIIARDVMLQALTMSLMILSSMSYH